MKRSDAIHEISFKLSKSENLFKGYANGSIDLKCLTDNLALRVMTVVEEIIEMSPPEISRNLTQEEVIAYNKNGAGVVIEDIIFVREWEGEDE